MAEKHYTGSCHCGAVRFEADLDLDGAMTCNCSRCQRLASVLSFTPAAKFTLLSGADNLQEYLFNTHRIEHQFCKTCGIQSFSYGKGPDGAAVVAVNANCLDGIDPRSLPVTHVDGASF